MLTFGERLRMARERKGLSQLDVYKATNIGNKSLSRYENNKTAPDPEAMKLLITLYDVSADFILGLSDEMGHAFPPAGTSKAQPKITKGASANDAEMLKKIEGLSPEAKEKAADYLEMLKTLQQVKSGDGVLDFKEKA